MEGFNNEVILWQCKMTEEHQYNADRALDLYWKGQVVEMDPESRHAAYTDTYWILARPNWKEILKELAPKDQLIAIAELLGPAITVLEATDIIRGNGSTDSNNRTDAYTQVQNMLSGMVDEGIFDKPAKGEYRLMKRTQETE
jgi:hypothetical protein